MNNYKETISKIILDFKLFLNNFNIKNLGIKMISNLKIRIDGKIFFLEKICEILVLENKIFLLSFKDINLLKNILKKNILENYGFQILKKKNTLELKVPHLSLEFRKKILNILKDEYQIVKELLENKRKEKLFEIKIKHKSLDEIKRLEKIIIQENNNCKTFLKKYFNETSFNILNE